MRQGSLFERYEEMQRYVGWTELDARAIQSIAGRLEGAFHAIVVDFHEEIDRHHEARKVLSGGAAQVERLKISLLGWLSDLCSGIYDADYVQRRWRVGLRHAELGLDQVFCSMAMARVRSGLLDALTRGWDREPAELQPAVLALNKLLDLDLAIIEDAYQTERLARQQQIERLAGLGQISAGVAHELRNPLNVIKTSVYFLLSARDPTAEKKAEHFSRIARHVELADGVISALSNFARMSAPQPRPFSVGACLREVLIQTGLPATVEVALVGLASHGRRGRRADPDRVQQSISQRARVHVREWTLDDYWQKRRTVRGDRRDRHGPGNSARPDRAGHGTVLHDQGPRPELGTGDLPVHRRAKSGRTTRDQRTRIREHVSGSPARRVATCPPDPRTPIMNSHRSGVRDGGP
ncbi:MAG: protoglobin domain-containing protein [Isosphaeraceae bacterium]|jgi:signal transduction histidine kinase